MGHGFVWARCPSVADVDCAGHFGGSGIPRVERPHRAFVVIVDPAAHQFGEQGEETQVLVVEENGGSQPVWTYGLDHYPPTPE